MKRVLIGCLVVVTLGGCYGGLASDPGSDDQDGGASIGSVGTAGMGSVSRNASGVTSGMGSGSGSNIGLAASGSYASAASASIAVSGSANGSTGMSGTAAGRSGAAGESAGSSGTTTGTTGSSAGDTGATGSSTGDTGATGSSTGAAGAAGSGRGGVTGATGSTSGASASGASGVDYNTPAQCSSGKTWKSGTGPTMRPGDRCMSCHGNFLAGTVYPTAHEPTDCDGANASGATVVITDAKGVVTTLAVNNVGNFNTAASIAKPFHAKVLSNGKESDMAAAQTSGDCNSCHTEQGANGAPGRIVLP